MLNNFEKFKLPIALAIVGIVLMLGGIFTSGLNKNQSNQFPKESLVSSSKTVSVDVSGAVVKSGVYQLKEGARIEDIIKAAGGFAENANQEYISKYLNLAQKLVDGSKVYVPLAGENAPASLGSTSSQTKVNINTATQAQIETLPGIGPISASKIISLRPYQVIEDLLNKKAVNKSVYEKIKDQLSLY